MGAFDPVFKIYYTTNSHIFLEVFMYLNKGSALLLLSFFSSLSFCMEFPYKGHIENTQSKRQKIENYANNSNNNNQQISSLAKLSTDVITFQMFKDVAQDGLTSENYQNIQNFIGQLDPHTLQSTKIDLLSEEKIRETYGNIISGKRSFTIYYPEDQTTENKHYKEKVHLKEIFNNKLGCCPE